MSVSLEQFDVACSAFCTASGKKRTWLSNYLFGRTSRLDDYVSGKNKIGYERLQEAHAKLIALEAERKKKAKAR